MTAVLPVPAHRSTPGVSSAGCNGRLSDIQAGINDPANLTPGGFIPPGPMQAR